MNYNKAEFEISFGTISQLVESTVPELVFAGRSNVGKSSLLNKLFNRKSLARVSSEPGKTATINFYRVEDVRFVDLPGYGFAKKPGSEKRRWADLIESYFASGRNVRLVVQLVDMRHAPSEDDKIMINYLQQTDVPFLIALTKADKLKKTAREVQRAALTGILSELGVGQFLEVSSATGEGIEALKAAIEDALPEQV
ncbi:MAG: ribosome biogenesis GTP-binding protein YihA/YsxC [Oscillospiraceae bacterium]|nr:ribosome biogenesis GTP-binding protein YihA/YsxC [Oscillospiraceae bacterium]